MACRMPNTQTHTLVVAAAIRNPVYRQEAVRMANELRTELEQVKAREDVQRALKQTSTVKSDEKPKAETKDKLWLGTHVIILLALAAFRYVLQFKFFGF